MGPSAAPPIVAPQNSAMRNTLGGAGAVAAALAILSPIAGKNGRQCSFVPMWQSTSGPLSTRRQTSWTRDSTSASPVGGAALGNRGSAGAATAVALAGAAGAAWRRRSRRARPNALERHAWEDQTGVQAPLGFWDPLGFHKDGTFREFYQYREAELKHGRVAMYACIGFVVPEFYRFPGYLSPGLDLQFADIPNGLKAFEVVPLEGWLQILAYIGWYEFAINQPQNPEEPGNYYKGRYGVVNRWWDIREKVAFSMTDKVQRRRSLNAELANGRLAMVAITGMVFQNAVVGNTGPEMWFPNSG